MYTFIQQYLLSCYYEPISSQKNISTTFSEHHNKIGLKWIILIFGLCNGSVFSVMFPLSGPFAAVFA